MSHVGASGTEHWTLTGHLCSALALPRASLSGPHRMKDLPLSVCLAADLFNLQCCALLFYLFCTLLIPFMLSFYYLMMEHMLYYIPTVTKDRGWRSGMCQISCRRDHFALFFLLMGG